MPGITERITRCPQCGKSCRIGSDNPWRPFCSERCKLIDLGDWLNEQFRIPSEHQDGITPENGEDQES